MNPSDFWMHPIDVLWFLLILKNRASALKMSVRSIYRYAQIARNPSSLVRVEGQIDSTVYKNILEKLFSLLSLKIFGSITNDLLVNFDCKKNQVPANFCTPLLLYVYTVCIYTYLCIYLQYAAFSRSFQPTSWQTDEKKFDINSTIESIKRSTLCCIWCICAYDIIYTGSHQIFSKFYPLQSMWTDRPIGNLWVKVYK